ncbi:MAG: hypothetical protein BGO21_31685 [Dyadobacter sp. 50-39]|uniref:DUF6934 family protein n=1 Tax=Dyadobacter sp. 50-39 TaxID=1895756 RepID=UPI0009677CE0|nr:hypothetical protein [Dyadobacter sp. 50-39]OJV15546.1 MAG: hypothetical protein BGO21_31685 [Dyadobacter sp. 50-39]
MGQPHYKIEYSIARKAYLFVSQGRHGCVDKVVTFQLIGNDIYNLAFGDWKRDDIEFDDLVVTDNGDMEMVLSTVIEITKMFLAANPDVYVYFTGSTAARTRLYQIIIGNISEIVVGQYDVWGELEGHWVPFEKNVNYEAFLVSKSL